MGRLRRLKGSRIMDPVTRTGVRFKSHSHSAENPARVRPRQLHHKVIAKPSTQITGLLARSTKCCFYCFAVSSTRMERNTQRPFSTQSNMETKFRLNFYCYDMSSGSAADGKPWMKIESETKLLPDRCPRGTRVDLAWPYGDPSSHGRCRSPCPVTSRRKRTVRRVLPISKLS